jgi:hypothetical protein
MSLPFPTNRVYRKAALLWLLSYASLHKHSHSWIKAITRIIQREGLADA